MALDLQDQEELENIKRIWHEWLKWIVLFLLILAGLYLVNVAWDNYKIKYNQRASELLIEFETLMGKKENTNALKLLSEIQSDYSDTMAATLATTSVASMAYYGNRLDDAYRHYQWIYDNQKNPFIQAVTLTDMARIKLQQQQFDAALALLDEAVEPDFLFMVEDLRGDIYLAKGDRNKAIESYNKALNSLPEANEINSQEDINKIRNYIEIKKAVN